MKVLFFGGCLLTTKTVARDKRFISVLQADHPDMEIELARYASFSLIEEIFSSHTAVSAPDIIVFLVRPFPFYTLTKLFPRVPGLNGGIEIKMHPKFSADGTEWFLANDRLIVEMDWNPNGTNRTFTHGINLFLGSAFRLDDWAIEYVKKKLLRLDNLCREKNIRFIVAGPPAVLNHPKERGLLAALNTELRSSFHGIHIPYLDLFTERFPEEVLGPDKVHYNDEGHFRLAKCIEGELFRLPVSAVRR